MVQRNRLEGLRRRVAIYCRVSTSDQDCDRQERDLKEYADRANFEVVGVFKERRSTQDLMDTLGQLASWDVSLIAQTGLTFDLSTPQGKLIANLMACLAEFEHDLLRERVKSGIATAKARGQIFGRRPGYRPSDKQAPKVVQLSEVGYSQRKIAAELGLSKTTVNDILKRHGRSRAQE